MSLRINTNISALTALRHLAASDGEMSTTISRLSSGMRINSAADDPAGLIISENMRSQLRGIGQALRNSQDAINMVKTAEGALDEVQTLLRDIRALAVHSANSAVVDSATLNANQVQVRSTLQSINRIAETTQFGNRKLLDGTAGAMANLTSSGLANSLYFGSNFSGETLTTGTISISQVTAAERALITLGNGFADANAIVTTSGSMVINGYAIQSDGTQTVQSLVSKINNMSAQTGVVASITGNGPVSVVLSSIDFGSKSQISFFDNSNVLHNATSAADSGVDGVYNVSATTNDGVKTALFTGGRGTGDSGLKLTDNYGNVIVLTENGNSTITGTDVELGQMTAGSVKFQIGPNSEQSTVFSMPVIFANRLGTGAIPGKSLADIDLTTEQGANEAMRIIDDAITQLASLRGDLGSFQKNFLDSTTRSLTVANENLTSSESSIRDADMALEITAMTRLQILKQSGMAVLAQANQEPQSILKLLQ